MDKEKSILIKGIAILMMIGYHCLPSNNSQLAEFGYYITLPKFLNEEAISILLHRILYPVFIYLIISGYGLFLSKFHSAHDNYVRVRNLYLNYWLVMLPFFLVGLYFLPERFSGSFKSIVENVTCWFPTNNHTVWFVLPYSIIVFLSPIIFKILNYCKKNFSFLIFFFVVIILWATTRLLIRTFPDYFNHDNIWKGCLATLSYLTSFLLPFSYGAIAAKTNLFDRIASFFCNKQYLCVLSLLLLVLSRMIVNDNKVNMLYSFMLVPLLVSIKYPEWLKRILTFMGNKNIFLWFIHGYIIIFIKDLLPVCYSSPLLFYLFILAVSILLSFFFEFFSKRVNVGYKRHSLF